MLFSKEYLFCWYFLHEIFWKIFEGYILIQNWRMTLLSVFFEIQFISKVTELLEDLLYGERWTWMGLIVWRHWTVDFSCLEIGILIFVTFSAILCINPFPYISSCKSEKIWSKSNIGIWYFVFCHFFCQSWLVSHNWWRKLKYLANTTA